MGIKVRIVMEVLQTGGMALGLQVIEAAEVAAVLTALQGIVADLVDTEVEEEAEMEDIVEEEDTITHGMLSYTRIELN